VEGQAAIFELDGDIATPSDLARGPWSPDAQHGGAPSSLLAGYLEGYDPGPATFPARFTVELMRPVPLSPLRIAARTVRPGKKVQLVEGSLHAGETEVVRATLLRLQENPVDFALPPAARVDLTMPPPGLPRPLPRDPSAPVGFWNTMEIAHAHGEWTEPGPAGMWFRLAVPVVAGETPTAFQRVAAVADFGNGVSAPFDRSQGSGFSVINPDLTITLHRLPAGEWVGLDAVTYPETAGFGVAESVLFDEQGRIGRGIQTVLIQSL
jgi:hypothetical protein